MVATAAAFVLASCAWISSAASMGGPVFDVLRLGAVGDGRTDDGAAIRRAYAACRAAGGGTVLFRSRHTFISGPIELACNDSVTVVESGATIRARNTTDGWPFGLDCPEPAQGKTPKQMAPMLQVLRGRNVSIEGGGEIDANGEMWWANACGNWWCQPTAESADQTRGPTTPTAFRPFHFRVDHSEHVRIQNVSLKNSGFWTLVPVHSSHLRVLDVNVSAEYTHRPPHWPKDRHDLLDTPNTDGIEPMWSSDVFISGARIVNGDDCITVKSGSSDILVEDLYCEHGDGLTIGSIWYDDVTNVTYRHVTMNRTHNGPMIKGRSQGNATVRDILFEHVTLHEVYLAITIDCDYETAGTVLPNIGVLASNVTFKNISGTVSPPRHRAERQLGDARSDPSFLVDAAGTFFCRESRPCSFHMEGVSITHADVANKTSPQWLCNNSILLGEREHGEDEGIAMVSPPLPAQCRHRFNPQN